MKIWGWTERCEDGFREVASTVWHPLLFCIPEREQYSKQKIAVKRHWTVNQRRSRMFPLCNEDM